MGTEPVSALSSFLSSLVEIGNYIFAHAIIACDTIVETPFLLLTVGFLFVGGAIGIVGRLLSRN